MGMFILTFKYYFSLSDPILYLGISETLIIILILNWEPIHLEAVALKANGNANEQARNKQKGNNPTLWI